MNPYRSKHLPCPKFDPQLTIDEIFEGEYSYRKELDNISKQPIFSSIKQNSRGWDVIDGGEPYYMRCTSLKNHLSKSIKPAFLQEMLTDNEDEGIIAINFAPRARVKAVFDLAAKKNGKDSLRALAFSETKKKDLTKQMEQIDHVMKKVDSDIGSEKEPILNSLLTFSTIDVVNSKLPCVSPPPSTNWKPTMLSENVPAPLDGLGGYL